MPLQDYYVYDAEKLSSGSWIYSGPEFLMYTGTIYRIPRTAFNYYSINSMQLALFGSASVSLTYGASSDGSAYTANSTSSTPTDTSIDGFTYRVFTLTSTQANIINSTGGYIFLTGGSGQYNSPGGSVMPIIRVDYNNAPAPTGSIRVNVSGQGWKLGKPYINVSGQGWKEGVAYIKTASGWEIGI